METFVELQFYTSSESSKGYRLNNTIGDEVNKILNDELELLPDTPSAFANLE